MELPLLLALYSIGLVVFSLVGGNLPQHFEMTHTRAQLAMSLVSGLMLGIALFHLLPHAVLAVGADGRLNTVMGWVALGLVVMLLLLRLLHFHQPDFYSTDGHDHDHGPVPVAVEKATAHWPGVLLGLSLHTVVDGVALGAALLGAPHGHAEELLGFGVFLAILLHKPLDAMAIIALMKADGVDGRYRHGANLVFALLCPAGAFLFYFSAGQGGASGEFFIAAALAFSAGAFMCIALSDLLPEVQFHSHDRGKLTAVFLAGLIASFLLANATPDHQHAVEKPTGSPTALPR